MNEEPDWRDSDRHKHLSDLDRRVLTMRQAGEDLHDRQGRARVQLGNGPESRLAQSIQTRPQRTWTETDAISDADFKRLYEAVAVANLNGWVLNTFVTIAWQIADTKPEVQLSGLALTGVPPLDAEKAARVRSRLVQGYQERFLENARAWFAYQRHTFGIDTPFAAIKVKEVGKTLGLHSHFLFHVPFDRRHHFRDWATKAAHKIVEAPRFSHRTRRHPTGLRLIHVSPTFEERESVDHQWRVFKYMMKGLDPDMIIGALSDRQHEKHLLTEFVKVETKPQGTVYGPRVGRTTDVGPEALARIQQEIGRCDIWPRLSFDDRELRYDNSFLRDGELSRQLRAIEI
jgi:hypothetical protein